MKRLVRVSLSLPSLLFLKEKRTAKVAKKRTLKTRVEEARALWALKRNKTFDEVHDKLERMCSGLKRCMYCEDSRGVAIDHFWPLSVYPLKAFEWSNYLYVCAFCNTIKGDDFPLDARGRSLLLDPTVDDPTQHLLLTPRTGKLRALTKRGRRSRRAYGLQREELVNGRRDTWIVLQSLIIDYAKLMRAGRAREAKHIETAIRRLQFSGVFVHLLTVAQGASASRLRPECLAALNAYPEIKTWK